VELVLEGLDPLLIVEAQRELDRVLRLSFLGFKLFLSELFVAKEPLEWWHDDLKGLSCTVPFGNNLAISTLISGRESDLLDRSVVETRSTDKDVSAADLWAKVGLNLLNSDVVVPKVNRLTCELLTVERHID